ncbi:MAG: hypothetical protein M0C28_38805 [Candidatus Moduliflexus flocculans]|nr:hypothetical protein [Candidatus Moduliflexus flocculans]
MDLLWEHYGRPAAGRRPLRQPEEVHRVPRTASSDRGIVRTLGKYGDWCPPGSVVPKKTPVDLTSTWYYYHDVLILARLAAVLGRGEEAREYERLAESVKTAFNDAYLGESQYAADPRQPGRQPSQPDLQPPAPPSRHGPRRPQRQGPGQPPAKRRGPPGLPPRHRHPRHPLPPRRPDRERPRRDRLPGGDPEELPGLGLHDRRGRDDALGAMGEARRARHELPEPHHARQHRRLVLPRPGRPVPRPARAGARSGSGRIVLGDLTVRRGPPRDGRGAGPVVLDEGRTRVSRSRSASPSGATGRGPRPPARARGPGPRIREDRSGGRGARSRRVPEVVLAGDDGRARRLQGRERRVRVRTRGRAAEAARPSGPRQSRYSANSRAASP